MTSKTACALVTGGAGFIGSHLVEELVRRDIPVTVFDSLSTGRLSNLAAVTNRVELVRGDLVVDDVRALLSERRFGTIFHLAGNANVTGSVENPRNDFERNVIGTFHLLEAVRASSLDSTVIFASSAVVFGEGATVPIREDDPKLPTSPYGVSKLSCEHYVRLFAELYGLRTVTARMFSVYGPRLRKQAVYDFMVKLQHNPDELFIHGDGTQVRDMSHISTMVAAMLLLAECAPCRGESYNVASGDAVSIAQLARALAEAMQLDPKFVFSGTVRAGETQRWFPDTSRLRALGFRPGLGLSEGLADVVRWFRTQQVNKEAAEPLKDKT